MLNRNMGSEAKIYTVLLLVLILFIPSCKKQEPSPGVGTGGGGTEQTSTTKPGTTTSESNGSDKSGNVAINFELPHPVFEGTPQDVKVPNLKPAREGTRPQFYAPAGTKNVALGKKVTSTDEFPIIGEFEMLTDGDKEAADGSFVELGPGMQSVTIDLGAEYDIYAILLWHFHKQARVYFDVVVQVAGDRDFINSKTIFNNDHDNSSGLGVGENMHYTETSEGNLIDAKGIRARYVRLYSNGNSSNDSNHYIEVEVFGRAAK